MDRIKVRLVGFGKKETEKWMEELRAKIERKRLQNRKLTAATALPKPVSISVRSNKQPEIKKVPPGGRKIGGMVGWTGSTGGAFAEDDDCDYSDEEMDPKTQEAVEKLVATVLANGVSAEEDVKTRNQSNPAYWFLNDKSSSPYKTYKRRVEEAGRLPSKSKSSKQPPPSVEGEGPSSHQSASTPEEHQTQHRKRKSRWESSPSASAAFTAVPPPGPLLIQGRPPIYPKTTTDMGHSCPAPRSTLPAQKSEESCTRQDSRQELSEAEKAALRAQMQARAVALRALEKIQPPGSVDVEDEIQRGSWEHTRRKEEMEKTKRDAVSVTQRNAGRHHLSDFLPPEEYQKFLERTQNAKQGIAADKSDYQDNKLTEGNRGFQLLQRMGWEEGRGLGSSGQGITAPVNSGKVEGDHVGLGAGSSTDVTDDDDEYSVYRKRMMLAYKFRPNPLNNPRRQYY